MANEIQKKQPTPIDRLKNVMEADSIQQQFKNALADNANLFTASVIDLFASDKYLQECNPNLVVMEALKAATLKLPISKSLGFAYIIAYKGIPQFQLGYKGMIQLVMRSGIYRFINAGTVYEGQLSKASVLTGELDISGDKISDTVVGYFSYIETVNGFSKSMYKTVDDMKKHAKKYSKSYGKPSSPWSTEFDAMAEKTMLRMILGKYGQMSIDMAEGIAKEHDPDLISDGGYSEHGNQEFIDIDTSTGEMINQDDVHPTAADLAKNGEAPY